MFTEPERTYLGEQRLARIATVSSTAQPDVAPVSYQFDGASFTIAGIDMPRTLKYRNVQRGNARVALVVDDLAAVQPWTPRGIKIHGQAEIVESERGPVLRVVPERRWSWGINQPAFRNNAAVFDRSSVE